MFKRRLKPQVKIAGIILIVLIVVFSLYKALISPPSSKKEKVDFIVEKGQTFSTVAKSLKKHKLIRSETVFKIYVKMKKYNGLHEGQYTLYRNMSIKQIANALNKKPDKNPNVVKITFKEGLNMRSIASLIEKNTNHTKEEVYGTLKNETYLTEKIKQYWFLTDTIKNPSIYYSLEGYLFPDTYEFMNKDVEITTIFDKMLEQTDKALTPYKEKISKSKYSIHELLTIASIVELEASFSDDRNGVATVFYNRLNAKWSLGSDVTTYYGLKLDVTARDLYQKEINQENAYNTRSSKMAGKLPIGPICNPGIKSIDAAINPKSGDYLYFVADKHKKTYFSKTLAEHNQIIAKLKKQGLWYQYQK